MNKKDIITVIIAGSVLVLSIFFIMSLLSPKTNINQNQQGPKKERTEISGDINEYERSLQDIKNLKDYGEGDLAGIGRVNPFGPLN